MHPIEADKILQRLRFADKFRPFTILLNSGERIRLDRPSIVWDEVGASAWLRSKKIKSFRFEEVEEIKQDAVDSTAA